MSKRSSVASAFKGTEAFQKMVETFLIKKPRNYVLRHMGRSEMTSLVLGHLILYFSLAILRLYYSLRGSDLGKISSAGGISWKQMQNYRVSNHLGDLPLLQHVSRARLMRRGLKNTLVPLVRTTYNLLCWASLVRTDKATTCSYPEPTAITSASVKDLLLHYRDRPLLLLGSIWYLVWTLAPTMQPWSKGLVWKYSSFKCPVRLWTVLICFECSLVAFHNKNTASVEVVDYILVMNRFSPPPCFCARS